MATSPYEISALSRVYIRARIIATINGATHDPTGDVVKMAFIPSGAAPTTGDFQQAIWETDATTNPVTYRSLCLVGPGGTVTLAVGTYRVWVQITDNPEVPVMLAGTLKVT
jgi:hypothetical protein